MRDFWCLALLLVTFASSAQTIGSKEERCGLFKVEFASQKGNPENTFEVSFNPTGEQGPVRYIFYELTGQLVSDAFTDGHYKGIKSGDYQCLAVDKRNCKQLLNIHLP